MGENRFSITALMEKILIIYIIINPLIDFATGLYIREFLGATELDIESSSFASTPSLYIRLAMLLIFGIYLLIRREKLAIGTLVIMGAAFCASIGVLLLTGAKLSLGTDVKYFVKYCYNIVMFFAYLSLMRSMCKNKDEFIEKVFFVIRCTCIICALGIIIPYIFSLGYYTYADRLGYRGCKGYFYSGNDITAVFTVLMPLAAAYFLSLKEPFFSKRSIISLFSVALSVVALFLIGSKTAFIAAIGTCGFLLVFALFSIRRHGKSYLVKLLQIVVLSLLLLLILGCIVGFGRLIPGIATSLHAPAVYANTESVEVVVLSGRGEKLSNQFGLFLDGGPLTWIFGIGRSTVDSIIEMDLFEVIIYYGVVGAAAMLWLYVWLAVSFIKSLLKQFDIISFALFIALGMSFGYLVLAGHVLFSVTSGQYFVLAIAFSRLYFAPSAEDAAVRPALLSRLLKA